MNEKKKYPFHELFFKREWSYTTGAVLLTILAVTLVSAGAGAWGVTGPFTQWGISVLALVGIDLSNIPGAIKDFNFWTNQPSVTNFGIVFGALVAVLLAAQFKIKKIKSWKNIAAAVSGGLLMGIGARIAAGCNIGALFSALPAFSLNGWLFLGAIFIGAAIGSQLLKKVFM
ncbi:MAG: YeeE/YedE thiosulfate transporter family protein [Clostridia bacterium]